MTRTLSDRRLSHLAAMVHAHAGISLGHEQRSMIEARLAKYLRRTGRSVEALVAGIDGESSEMLDELIDVLTTNFTSFFREVQHFDWFGRWLTERRKPARIWCGACATGEEAYSLAITMREVNENLGQLYASSLYASDLSRNALATAQRGIYPRTHLAALNPDRVRRWFQRGVGDHDGTVRVKGELRDLVTFTRHNILEPPPHDALDVIFLRNVMIYFDDETAIRVIEHMRSALAPGGYLVVGHAENVRHLARGFQLHGHTLLEKQ